MKNYQHITPFDFGEDFSPFDVPYMDRFIKSKQESVLQKSSAAVLWKKFLKEVFSEEVDFKEIIILSEEEQKTPGAHMVIVPSPITLSKCFEPLHEKLGIQNTFFCEDEEKILFLRRKKLSYLTYLHPLQKREYVLEVILLGLFRAYINGDKRDQWKCKYTLLNIKTK